MAVVPVLAAGVPWARLSRSFLRRPAGTMTFQWTAVAAFLYGEIGVILVLCLPFISPLR